LNFHESAPVTLWLRGKEVSGMAVLQSEREDIQIALRRLYPRMSAEHAGAMRMNEIRLDKPTAPPDGSLPAA
jgi:hypothetical protein